MIRAIRDSMTVDRVSSPISTIGIAWRKGRQLIDLDMKNTDLVRERARMPWSDGLSEQELHRLRVSTCSLAARAVSPVHLAGLLVELWDELAPATRRSLLTVDRLAVLSGALIRQGCAEHADRLIRQ